MSDSELIPGLGFRTCACGWNAQEPKTIIVPAPTEEDPDATIEVTELDDEATGAELNEHATTCSTVLALVAEAEAAAAVPPPVPVAPTLASAVEDENGTVLGVIVGGKFYPAAS